MWRNLRSPGNVHNLTGFQSEKSKSSLPLSLVEFLLFPRSAYLLYYFDVHQVMQLGIPNMPQSEINKRISESWKRLSVAEKSYYLEKAKLEKEGMDTVSYIVNLLTLAETMFLSREYSNKRLNLHPWSRHLHIFCLELNNIFCKHLIDSWYQNKLICG